MKDHFCGKGVSTLLIENVFLHLIWPLLYILASLKIFISVCFGFFYSTSKYVILHLIIFFEEQAFF